MRTMKTWMLGFGVACALVSFGAAQDAGKLRSERDRMMNKGLWRETVSQYQGELGGVADGMAGEDLRKAVEALGRLDAWGEFDDLIETAAGRQLGNAAFLIEAAQRYFQAPHGGRIIGGDFERKRGPQWMWRGRRGAGGGDNGGEWVDVAERDRVRGLQLALRATEAGGDDKTRVAAWESASRLLKFGRESGNAWKFQVLTGLDELPDWGDSGPQGGTEGAPWLGDAPVFYDVPESWKTAENDGERWRWALSQRAKAGGDPGRAAAEIERADFLRGQFGVGTLAGFGWWRSMDPESAKGLLEIDSLAENECLAKTSDGVKRFKLPPGQDFIAIYREIAAGETRADEAMDKLTSLFLDRRQRDKAAEVLAEKIRRFKPKKKHPDRELLAQITGNWGRFESAPSFSAGTNPELPFVYRNAESVKLSVAPIDMEAVLREVRRFLESNPRKLDHWKINPNAIGWRIVRENEGKFLGKAKEWTADLKPRPKHRDTRAMIKVPVEQAGAWMITAELPDGNKSRIVAWLNDTAILKRPVGDSLQWWVADAVTGAPVAGAQIDFFGYRTESIDRKLPLGRYRVLTKAFRRTTDADGRTMLNVDKETRRYSWLAIARLDGRRAFFGFDRFRWQSHEPNRLDRAVVFGTSDRPLYRAGDTVNVNFWLRKTAYEFNGKSAFAGTKCRMLVHDGTGQQIVERKDLRLDEWGGVELSFEVPKDARLGAWRASIDPAPDKLPGGMISFRVEEFRKPEYEVTVDAPEKPVRLGDAFEATVRADYFHGAPVTNATVRVKVLRSSLGERWFPVWGWDWLYGPGAWWPMPKADWCPGWESWHCIVPPPPWWGGGRWTPDELVFEKTMPIGPDGTAKVRVDTSLAKEIHGDLDARYRIEAEVIDASRRSEHGTGTVTAARKPFEVAVWLDRGWARPGDAATATWSVATLDGTPVKRANGTLELFALTVGADGKVTEKSLRQWEIVTDDEGRGTLRFELPEEGQYRLSAKLTAAGGDKPVEGAAVVGVHGVGKSKDKWRFGPLEIVADKVSYRPGETAHLRVQSDRADASVWLFLRAEGQGSAEARRIDLVNGSAEIELPLSQADMPNIFIEGVAVHGGRTHTAVRQILMPPESRVLNVDLDAPRKVKPREKSRLRVRVTDAGGKPFSGTAVVTVYDKALEAIVGGSNVGDIAKHFWSWRRNYWGGGVGDSLTRIQSTNLVKKNEKTMRSLGRFGDDAVTQSARGLAMPVDGGGGGFGGKSEGMMMEADAARSMNAAPSMKMSGAVAGAPPAAGGPKILVRKDFADLVKWAGEVEVGPDGTAELPVEFPDNLTTWKAKVWVLGAGTRVGEGEAEIVTSKDLLVRLQAPRFLVETDESTLSAIVHNYRDVAKRVAVSLEIPGGVIERIGGKDRTVTIKPGGEARVEWRVRALREGEATVRMIAKADDDGDAMERTLPVLVHGMLRQDAWSRMIAPDADETHIEIEVPEKRRPAQTKLTVRFSPSVAGAVIDAIPYLAGYPHGCTEQTINRFVPAVIARKMLIDLGIDLEALRAKRANLNPQELGDPATRAEQWKRWKSNPVFDSAELDKMIAEGLARLAKMQNSDGGWGWFSGWGEYSYPHTTAIVVHGLLEAKECGVKVEKDMLPRGVAWLAAYEKKQTRMLQRHEREMKKPGKRRNFRNAKSKSDALDSLVRRVLGEAGRDDKAMLAFLFRDRLDLPVYAQCLLGLELDRTGAKKKRDACLATIEQFRKDDPENQTSYLELPNRGYWWRWYGSEIETHTWYLQLLNAVKPKARETRGLVKYIVNNRKHASWWDSTRDTAYAVEAIAGFLKASGEDAPEMEVDVILDGKILRTVAIDKDNMFAIDNTVIVAGDALSGGKHSITVRRRGKGPVYANAYLEVFTLEDHLRAAGLEVKVKRMVRRLTPENKTTAVPDAVGLITDQQTEAFRREDLADGDTVASGDLIEVELIIDSKNDYEYLVFEDWKPAGFDAVQALSGYLPGALSAYMEPRDEKVAFYVRSLPRGSHTIRYRLRAETPGIYHALPARADAMYAPELRANSEGIKLGVK